MHNAALYSYFNFSVMFLNTGGKQVNKRLQVLPWYFPQEPKDLQTGNNIRHMGRLASAAVGLSVWGNLFFWTL